MGWTREHRIKWIETRVVRCVGKVPEEERPRRIDLEIWLAKERDGLSWRQIALQFYKSKNAAAVSKARRAYDRVQRSHPGVEGEPRQRPGPKPKIQA